MAPTSPWVPRRAALLVLNGASPSPCKAGQSGIKFCCSRTHGSKHNGAFVISYRCTTGEVDYTGFDDFSAALKLRHKLESENTDLDVEIVSLTSESLEMLKQTHRRYFRNEFLADQLSLGSALVIRQPRSEWQRFSRRLHPAASQARVPSPYETETWGCLC